MAHVGGDMFRKLAWCGTAGGERETYARGARRCADDLCGCRTDRGPLFRVRVCGAMACAADRDRHRPGECGYRCLWEPRCRLSAGTRVEQRRSGTGARHFLTV